jgi:hypothetical protein
MSDNLIARLVRHQGCVITPAADYSGQRGQNQ